MNGFSNLNCPKHCVPCRSSHRTFCQTAFGHSISQYRKDNTSSNHLFNILENQDYNKYSKKLNIQFEAKLKTSC